MSLNHEQAAAVMDTIDNHNEPYRTIDKVVIGLCAIIGSALLVVLFATR